MAVTHAPMIDLPSPETHALLLLPIAFVAMIAPRPQTKTMYGKLSWTELAILVALLIGGSFYIQSSDIFADTDAAEPLVTAQAQHP